MRSSFQILIFSKYAFIIACLGLKGFKKALKKYQMCHKPLIAPFISLVWCPTELVLGYSVGAMNNYTHLLLGARKENK